MMKGLTSFLLALLLLISTSSASSATEAMQGLKLAAHIASDASTDVTEPEDATAAEAPTALEPSRPDEIHPPFISGMPDGSFRPNAPITRAELAKILYTLGDYASGQKYFSDVRSSAWYARPVNALAAAGILKGYGDGSFRPDQHATRAELVTILVSISGEAPSASSTGFSDVPKRHWAAGNIALAREKGWVQGYGDGSFRPSNSVTRAETVVIVNRFLGRIPDAEAIAAGIDLRFFPDVRKSHWFYEAVMEASTFHRASFSEDGKERWYDMQSCDLTTLEDGFYYFDGKLFAVKNGSYVHSAEANDLQGIAFTCAGSSGVCTVQAEALTLANGQVILLNNGKALAGPGEYEDGFFLKGGHLYVAQNGYLLNTPCSGSCEGVRFDCNGSSGRCAVEDWTQLQLKGIDLSVFSDALTPEATASGAGIVTMAQALQAAVGVYETYFQVEYPTRSDQSQDYVQKALEYGILEAAQKDYDQPVQRGQVATYLWRALRGRCLEPINDIPNIPDVEPQSSCYRYVLELYRAGVMTGTGQEHLACITETLTVTELAELLTRLQQPAKRLSFTIQTRLIKTIQYGISGSGTYPLTAYQIGEGKHVMILTFALHGWEDNWDRDGEALVYLADDLQSYLEANYDLVRDGDWTVYILRCLNPDGLYLGSTCNGPGRCTTTSYDSEGNLVSQGIDMNRCFPYKYRSYTGDRNYNGPAPLACAEAQAVAEFVTSVKGSGHNILIDTHGWFSQIITSSGKGTLYNTFLKQFPGNYYGDLANGSGYFSSWAAFVQGYDSCLMELPDGYSSYNAFLASDCVSRFEASIQDLLLHYNGPSDTRSLASSQADPDAVEIVLDGN